MEQLSVQTVLFPLCGVLLLAQLKLQLLGGALQKRRKMPAQIGGFLVHDRVAVLFRVEALQGLGHGSAGLLGLVRVHTDGEGRELQRHILIVQDDRLIIIVFQQFHKPVEGVVQPRQILRGKSRGGLIPVDACPVADLLGHEGADARIALVNRAVYGHRAGAYAGKEGIFFDGERILFALLGGDKVGSAGKYFPHGAHLGGDVLDAVDDDIVFIAENNIAVFAHQLHIQIFYAGIAHFI